MAIGHQRDRPTESEVVRMWKMWNLTQFGVARMAKLKEPVFSFEPFRTILMFGLVFGFERGRSGKIASDENYNREDSFSNLAKFFHLFKLDNQERSVTRRIALRNGLL